jgi:hypothetical protein
VSAEGRTRNPAARLLRSQPTLTEFSAQCLSNPQPRPFRCTPPTTSPRCSARPRQARQIVGPAPNSNLAARENIELGHKVALAAIPEGAPIVKFGIAIGIAMRPIEPGEWVHLHNCRSQLDERSGHFDVHTGEPGDNAYA